MTVIRSRAMDAQVQELLDRARNAQGLVVALTGAGVSAESGIPTFRGEEGYWTVGSAVYHPQELATRAAFRRMPVDVWQWYLYRRTVCRRAAPNAAHEALVALEHALGDRFRLITQNVDGLHLRAGSSPARTYQVHGNIDFMRCASECTTALHPIPAIIGEVDRDTRLEKRQVAALRCPACGDLARPHVLWFDEFYDEALFRFESAIATATQAALVLTIGTSASTNLPWHVVQTAARAGAVLIDVNTADNPFGEIAARHGSALRGTAAELVPQLIAGLGTAP